MSIVVVMIVVAVARWIKSRLECKIFVFDMDIYLNVSQMYLYGTPQYLHNSNVIFGSFDGCETFPIAKLFMMSSIYSAKNQQKLCVSSLMSQPLVKTPSFDGRETFPIAKLLMMSSIYCTKNQQKNMCKFPHELTDDKNTIVSTVGEWEKRKSRVFLSSSLSYICVLHSQLFLV
jgi:hypothetical protein